MLSTAQIIVLLRLLVAHLLADFLMQPESWIARKKARGAKSSALYYHSLVVGVVTYLFLADWAHFGLPLFIMVTHFLIDWLKSASPETAGYFVLDQSTHLIMIFGGWIIYAGVGAQLGEVFISTLGAPSFWIVLISYITVIWPFGYLIAILTSRWQRELADGNSEQLSGLENAGMWIGRSERFIILTLILLNQYSAIGFLIAAKSIFRFSGKLDGNRERKEAEYILIGTLLSFALSISVGIGTSYFLQLWG